MPRAGLEVGRSHWEPTEGRRSQVMGQAEGGERQGQRSVSGVGGTSGPPGGSVCPPQGTRAQPPAPASCFHGPAFLSGSSGASPCPGPTGALLGTQDLQPGPPAFPPPGHVRPCRGRPPAVRAAGGQHLLGTAGAAGGVGSQAQRPPAGPGVPAAVSGLTAHSPLWSQVAPSANCLVLHLWLKIRS